MMQIECSVVSRFRAATAAAHQALDGTLKIVERLRRRDTRIALLRRYHTLHASTEQAMAPFLANGPGLDFPRRRRAPLIAFGLHQLGASPPPTTPPAPIASHAASIGALYVMEGSTLGGRMILRQLRAETDDLTGLDFLDPYGSQTGRMWQAVTQLMEQALTTEAACAAAIAAANDSFRRAASCLADRALRLADAAA